MYVFQPKNPECLQNTRNEQDIIKRAAEDSPKVADFGLNHEMWILCVNRNELWEHLSCFHVLMLKEKALVITERNKGFSHVQFTNYFAQPE
jgi:hypothetical protein